MIGDEDSFVKGIIMLPKKALKKSQLTMLTAGAAVNDGSHQIMKAEFNEDGKRYWGFFKKLAVQKDFPDLLAKLSVAAAFFKNIFQGNRSAEERLVFDEDNRLVGIFSIAVEGFQPLNFANEEVPEDEEKKDLVIPSTQKLIDCNIMEILLGRNFLDDDDVHPHNISLKGDIDHDMFWYWLSIYIKSPRPIVGVTKTRVSHTEKDWQRFPNVEDSKPFHWPTYTHPGQETLPNFVPGASFIARQVLPKIYADPSAFVKLAGNAKAQEQKMAAAMKILLTYQPEMIRKRLKDYFGELTLNYTALEEKDPALPKKFEEKFPRLFNSTTNAQSFIDFIMTIYQAHYDSFYRVVVFYKGCENNGYGMALPATSHALYTKPSYFAEIKEWMRKQNETVYAKDEASHRFDLEELDKRYHQVWRDAFAPGIVELLHNSYRLTNTLLKQVSTETTNIEVVRTASNDDSVTNVWHIFGSVPEISVEQISKSLKVSKNTPLHDAVILLAQFTSEFYQVSKEYYQKERQDLTVQDNELFCKRLGALLENHNVNIREHITAKLGPLLGNTTTYADEFNSIALGLQHHINQVNFRLHLTTRDDQMRHVTEASPSLQRPSLSLSSDELKKQFNQELFRWAKNAKSEDLKAYILEVVEEHYESALSLRSRAEPVKKYLNASAAVPGDIRLSYILSTGNDDGSGTLNKNIIKYLTPKMLPTASTKLNPIKTVVAANKFSEHLDAYTRSAVAFAKNEFIHVCSEKGMELFYKAFYYWVENYDKAKFPKLIDAAVKDYTANLSTITTLTSKTRAGDVKSYIDKYSNQAKIVGLIFVNGTDTSTLNRSVFSKIVTQIKSQIKKGTKVYSDPDLVAGFNLINQYDETLHDTYYFSNGLLSKFAKPQSSIIESSASNANSAAYI